MLFTMEKYITFNPIDVTLLSTNAIVLTANNVPDLIEQARLLVALIALSGLKRAGRFKRFSGHG
jgi:hypothetical protein